MKKFFHHESTKFILFSFRAFVLNLSFSVPACPMWVFVVKPYEMKTPVFENLKIYTIKIKLSLRILIQSNQQDTMVRPLIRYYRKTNRLLGS